MSSRAALTQRQLGRAFRITCLVGTAGALWWFVRNIDLHALSETFERAALWPLLLAVLLNFASQFVRALAWLVMLHPRHPVPLGRLVRCEFAAQAASSISPANAGEVMRLWLLKQDGVPAATTGALIALKKLFEGIGLATVVVPLPWLLPGLPLWVSGAVLLFAVTMATLLVLLAVAARYAQPDKLPRILRSLVRGMYFLNDSRRILAALAVALLGEAIDVGAAAAVLSALHIHLTIAGAAFVLFLVDISNLLPVAPGHLGSFQLGALSALDLLHVQRDPAFAFAMLFNAQQVLPQVLPGLPLEVRFLLARRHRTIDSEPLEDASTNAEPDRPSAAQRWVS